MTDVLNGGAPAPQSEHADPVAAQANADTTNPHTDGAEGGEGSPVTPKTFSQDDVNEIVRKAKAAAEAKAERRVLRTLEKLQPQQSAPQQPSQQQNDGKPARAHYASDEAYVDALTDWKLEQRDRRSQAERQREQHQTLAQKTESIYAEAQKLPGFDREAFDELPLTKPIVEALVDSDAPAKLMHHLASHPEEVERIAKLSPARQAAELGKLEAALPKTPKTSKAPDPVGDPTARGSTTVATSDLSKLPMDKYIEARKKQGAKWARNY